MKLTGVWLVHLATFIAIAGAMIHVAAVFGGPSWYALFGAPPVIVTSAQAGTWLAPVSALVIAVLMTTCSLYAASAAGLVRRLPLLRLGLVSMAVVCIARGLLLPAAALSHPELLNTFEIVSAFIWFVAGMGFAVGSRISRAKLDNSSKPTLLRGAT